MKRTLNDSFSNDTISSVKDILNEQPIHPIRSVLREMHL